MNASHRPCFSDHVVDRLGDRVVLGHLGALLRPTRRAEPRPGADQLLPGSMAVGSAQPVQLAFDVEDGVDLLHRLQRDGGDIMGGFVLCGRCLRMSASSKNFRRACGPAQCADHRAWIAIEQVQTVVARIDIRLQHALPSGEVLFPGADHSRSREK